MGRLKKFGKRKSVFNGNLCKNKQNISEHNLSEPSCSRKTHSASSKKLSHIKPECDDNFHISDEESSKGFIILDIQLLCSLVKKSVQCKFCGGIDCVELIENKNSRRGLATKLSVVCNKCKESTSSMISNIIGKTKCYEVNLRFVYALRCTGRGRKPAETLCAIMDLPPPTAKFNFCTSQLLKCLEDISKQSMANAVEEAVTLNENSRDITAAFDGSWQKRGHTSLNGVITATSLDNGKVIDVECLTKFCHNCKSDEPGHVCNKNYDGFSGGMESEGVVKMFQRSEQSYQVRYVNYLGDGDSKGYKKVEELNVYGNVKVNKLECCGHVQKRMGTRLRKLRKDMKGKKCSDDKPLTGRGRLTDSAIDQLQTYYGLAIRRSAGKDVEKMRRAVWAIYYHRYSTDEEPYHTHYALQVQMQIAGVGTIKHWSLVVSILITIHCL